jgi:hypothetical protein
MPAAREAVAAKVQADVLIYHHHPTIQPTERTTFVSASRLSANRDCHHRNGVTT